VNVFNPLLKELFELAEKNTPKPTPKRPSQKKPAPKAPPKPVQPQAPKPEVVKPEPAPVKPERTVAGIPLNRQTVRQGIIISEILGKPKSLRK
jgi:hypothetical protein